MAEMRRHRAQQSAGHSTSQPPPRRPAAALPARALYAYAAQNEGDVELVAGQELWVLARHADGWWEGEAGGVRGTFPGSYVELLEEEAKPAAAGGGAAGAAGRPAALHRCQTHARLRREEISRELAEVQSRGARWREVAGDPDLDGDGLLDEQARGLAATSPRPRRDPPTADCALLLLPAPSPL